LGTCSNLVTIFFNLLKSVTHIPYHKIHPLHLLCQGLNLELYITLGMRVVCSSDQTWLYLKKLVNGKKTFPHVARVSLKIRFPPSSLLLCLLRN
jgi:hypothetical protein